VQEAERFWCPFSQVLCAGGTVSQREYAAQTGIKCRFWGVEYVSGQGTREHTASIKETCLVQEALTKFAKR